VSALLLTVGGAIGAVCRYLVGQLVDNRGFPWSTLVVNGLGSALLGAILFGTASRELHVLIATGFCGAFTTFSSFSVETVGLWELGKPMQAATNALANLSLSLLGFGAAWAVLG
jgi:CrcB protein